MKRIGLTEKHLTSIVKRILNEARRDERTHSHDLPYHKGSKTLVKSYGDYDAYEYNGSDSLHLLNRKNELNDNHLRGELMMDTDSGELELRTWFDATHLADYKIHYVDSLDEALEIIQTLYDKYKSKPGRLNTLDDLKKDPIDMHKIWREA